jgi:hypothetical protein
MNSYDVSATGLFHNSKSILRKTAGDASTYSPRGSSDQRSSKYRHVVMLKQGNLKMVRKGRVDGMIGSMGEV